MRTLMVDVGRLAGPVLVREAPTPVIKKDGTPAVSSDGEQVFTGKVLLPGGARSVYSDTATPTQVVLKLLGTDQGITTGLARLSGRVTLTRWYNRGARGGPAKSDLTIRPERIEQVTSGAPTITGWLPVEFMANGPDDVPVLLGEVTVEQGLWRAYLSCPAGTVSDGVAEVDTRVPVSHLVGHKVRPTLWCKLIQPDVEDLGRSTKAELPLMATAWESAGTLLGQADDPKPRGRERQEAPAAEVAG